MAPGRQGTQTKGARSAHAKPPRADADDARAKAPAGATGKPGRARPCADVLRADDPHRPKRPKSAYLCFLESFRRDRAQGSGRAGTAVAQRTLCAAAGAAWRALPSAEREPFVAESLQSKALWASYMRSLRECGGSLGGGLASEAPPLPAGCDRKRGAAGAARRSKASRTEPPTRQGQSSETLREVPTSGGMPAQQAHQQAQQAHPEQPWYLPGLGPGPSPLPTPTPPGHQAALLGFLDAGRPGALLQLPAVLGSRLAPASSAALPVHRGCVSVLEAPAAEGWADIGLHWPPAPTLPPPPPPGHLNLAALAEAGAARWPSPLPSPGGGGAAASGLSAGSSGGDGVSTPLSRAAGHLAAAVAAVLGQQPAGRCSPCSGMAGTGGEAGYSGPRTGEDCSSFLRGVEELMSLDDWPDFFQQ